MPELPEVQTVVATLRPHLLGRTIRRARLLRRDILRPAGIELTTRLARRRVTDLARRGKRIILQLDDGHRLCIHLGMTGRLTAQPPADRLAPHTHLLLDLDGPPLQIRFCDPRRFGGLTWLDRHQAPDDGLGPEPLNISADDLAARLAATRRPIKSALLDQALLAGLGNIYVDESLFAARIHPLWRANALSGRQVAALGRAIKSTLRRALRHGGSTLRDYVDADNARGRFQDLHCVYGRTGQPCRRCRQPIARMVLSGRSTHFCPGCQPAMAPSLKAACVGADPAAVGRGRRLKRPLRVAAIWNAPISRIGPG